MATDPLSWQAVAMGEAGRPSTAPSVRRGGEPSASRSHTGRSVALDAVDADEALEERVARSGVPQTGRRSGSLWKKAAGAMANGAFSPPKLKPPSSPRFASKVSARSAATEAGPTAAVEQW